MEARRDFLRLLAAAGAVGLLPTGRGVRAVRAAEADNLYQVPLFGSARILHTSDIHAQLLPVYFREPNVNIGLGAAGGKPPHLVGEAMLRHYQLAADSPLAYTANYLGMEELAARYGKTGGLAYLTTLARRLRADAGEQNTLHLDSGDLLQGSATALYSDSADMIAAANLLGIDALTGHWEFTLPESVLRQRLQEFNGVFLAHNVYATEEALFNDAEVYDDDSGHVFPPWRMFTIGGHSIVVIGQAFPYTPIANPRRFIPDWTFGVRRQELQALIEHLRGNEKPAAIILLSHNGTDLDKQMAADISGIDFILGGHTHDVLPQPIKVGQTVVLNGGCSGKFLGCLDLAFSGGKVSDFRYHLLPVLANYLPADTAMQELIEDSRVPYASRLDAVLATTDETLYRRGNFNGSMDQVIVDALRAHYDAEISLSPGFRWGPTVLAGEPILMRDLMNVTAITYPETYKRGMLGADLKAILEGVADNFVHPDPYYRQGGDMVRVGGIDYTLDFTAESGNRIHDLRLDNGKSIQPTKMYQVAGWATVNPSEGIPIWDVVAPYLRAQKTVSLDKINLPALRGVAGNEGIADYPSDLLT